MRAVVCALVALCVGACGKAPTCDITAARPVAFTSAAASDEVTARTIGASCDKAIAVLAVASGEGHPIWAFAAPLPRVFGEDYLNPGREDVEALIERWSEPEIARTSAAPAWPTTMLHTPEGATITLDRDTYEDIRARDLPMLCHLASPGRETCVFYEPAAAGAAVLYERDVAAEAPAQ